MSDTWTKAHEHNIGSVTEPHYVVDSEKVRELEQERDEAMLGHERYEVARKMNPRQWADAWELNIKTGKPFDEIIDDMRLKGE